MRPVFGKGQRLIAYMQWVDKNRTLHMKKVYPTIDLVLLGTIPLPTNPADPGGQVVSDDCMNTEVGRFLLGLDGCPQFMYGLWRSYQ